MNEKPVAILINRKPKCPGKMYKKSVIHELKRLVKSQLRMVISFVKKYNRLLSVSCRVGDLSLPFSCRVGEYFFVCQFLSAS